MQKPIITIRGTCHATAHEAIQYLSVSADDRAILLGGMHMTVSEAEAERLEASGVPFAYLSDRDGRIMTVPANDSRRTTMTTNPITHLDYAEEAQSAERAEAWPQAAALWRRAADALRANAEHTTETFDLYAKYQAAADACDARDRINRILERIAKTKLQISTLREQRADHLDFHEVSVWGLKEALRAAYEAGRDDQKK